MAIKEILNEFVGECSKKLDLEGIIQFGSSTYSKNFNDIDLIFVSKDQIISTRENLMLIKIIKDFEKKYTEIVFDFGRGEDRKRIAKYSITIVFISKKLLSTKYNPHDLFFFKNLSLDKNIKILLGKNLFENKKIILTNQHLFEMLHVDLKMVLRRSLDDENYKNESMYFLFKTYLRAMLINEGHFKKNELLNKFKEKFGFEIRLPKNAEEIIIHKIKKEDFQDILKFCENCLKYLIKEK